MRALAIPLLLALAACATARPVEKQAVLQRGRDEMRVVAGLQHLWSLQMTYQAIHGRFAATLDELKQVGWEEQDFGSYRPVITDSGSRLCVAMLPIGERRPAWSMSGRELLYRGPRCGR
ncbi:MAG TPA: hypothetical protein VFS20_20535 [Longimicrobium sp.]|nr:hypothetical protein [Longimicrobium sp.]